MEDSFNNEKIKILEMQANYLRYLASVYPLQSSPLSSNNSSAYSSLSPQRSSRDYNPHDNIPVKKMQKPFEVLLEEELQHDPSANTPRNYSVGITPATTSNSAFLKRGEGHLCSYTRSFSSSKLNTIRNRVISKESHENEKLISELKNLNLMKKQIDEKAEEIKQEEKELKIKKRVELKEIHRLKSEKSKEIYSPAKTSEVDALKKTIQRMTDADKLKDLKHQDEIRKLNAIILKLTKKVNIYEKNNTEKFSRTTPQKVSFRTIKSSPEKNRDNQGKIKQFVEKKHQISAKKEIRNETPESVVHFPNKDIKQVFPDGRTVIKYAESKTVFTSFPNGLKIYKYGNGQMEKHLLGGNKEITYPDGTIKTVFENGNEEIVYPDGEVELVNNNI